MRCILSLVSAQDKYSHILYVKEKRGQLSNLAQRAVKTDKFCPETCVVAGNHYALKGNHDKAVLYFKRALELNRRYLAAWTLMGHEYVELKNTAAAVAAYRRVRVHRMDWRVNGWVYRLWISTRGIIEAGMVWESPMRF